MFYISEVLRLEDRVGIGDRAEVLCIDRYGKGIGFRNLRLVYRATALMPRALLEPGWDLKLRSFLFCYLFMAYQFRKIIKT